MTDFFQRSSRDRSLLLLTYDIHYSNYGRQPLYNRMEFFIYLFYKSNLLYIQTLDWMNIFMYFFNKYCIYRCIISFNESNVKIRIVKALTVIDDMEREFFQAVTVSILLYGCTIWTLPIRLKKKPDKNNTNVKQILKVALCKTVAVGPLASYLIKHPSKTSNTCWPLI